MPTGSARARGFAYLLLLALVAVIALATTAAVSLGAAAQRRSAERQLLAIGKEYQQALRSYAGAPPNAPAGQFQGPRTLDDLLKDPRVPGIRRHLRRIYDDPLTGNAEWGTVLNAQGRIVGVYSLAAGRPLKQTGFEPELASFEQAETYQQWVFGFAPITPR
jgi:type II secretory pathway pseudopilin PulG